MGFGDFYKGDSKKKKKGQAGRPISASPVFIPPKVAPKGKDKF